MANQKINQISFVETISRTVSAKSRPFFMFLSIVVVVAALFFSYNIWVAKRERAAQYDFSALITEYDVMSREKDPQWLILLDKFEKNYQKHSSSSLLPYYQAYKVKILLKNGNPDAALMVLDAMIKNMQSSPIVALYEMERALIKLDSADKTVNADGLEALKILANDQKNIFRDTAQFYLGRYYWSIDQIDLARNVWKQLVDEQYDEKIACSPWVSQVEELLKLKIV